MDYRSFRHSQAIRTSVLVVGNFTGSEWVIVDSKFIKNTGKGTQSVRAFFNIPEAEEGYHFTLQFPVPVVAEEGFFAAAAAIAVVGHNHVHLLVQLDRHASLDIFIVAVCRDLCPVGRECPEDIGEPIIGSA